MYLLVLFTSLFSVTVSQVATPTRRVGLVYSRSSRPAKVQLEVYLDLICPDSRAAWPNLIDLCNHYSPEDVALTVHLFPLPYHQNSFYATRATFVIHHLTNGAKTFEWIGKILREKLPELTDRSFHNNSDADLLELFSQYVTEMGLNVTAFLDLVDRRTYNTFEAHTRVMWKHACSRGVAGTPTYMINGIVQPNILQSWGVPQWKLVIDPLIEPQVFDDIIPSMDDQQGVTHPQCGGKNSGSTKRINLVFHIIFLVAALHRRDLTMTL